MENMVIFTIGYLHSDQRTYRVQSTNEEIKMDQSTKSTGSEVKK